MGGGTGILDRVATETTIFSATLPDSWTYLLAYVLVALLHGIGLEYKQDECCMFCMGRILGKVRDQSVHKVGVTPQDSQTIRRGVLVLECYRGSLLVGGGADSFLVSDRNDADKL